MGLRGPSTFAELEKALLGKECYAGLDLASTDDTVALVLVFPKDEWAVLSYFWCPRENAVERERKHRVPYTTWAREEFLTLTPGNTCDFDFVEKAILETAKRYRVKELAYDRFLAGQIVTHLQGENLTVVPFGQGFLSMNPAAKHLDILVKNGTLRHGGHPVLRWQANNVMLEKDAADNWKPSKKRSKEKIDGIVALCMALGRAIVEPPRKKSVYERRGPIVI